ncbi:Fluconazole resistance protein 1 [Colletotrichum aenigma]|uniref:Fluconazole resistance protein 1 n=1 Tax=Colletotrichum aenigma TaxID=1215731 RepID=UPI0018731000|nr:Fluconazole resistance protein 1 [Colletotrichum aenigma]KAF5517592.1 Fluconazole resistance protein 1 [Colletotrichum aenigma]
MADNLAISDDGKLEGDRQATPEWKWEDDPSNPYNWPSWKKNVQLAMISIVGFTCSVGTSIVSPARSQFMDEFKISSTAAFLPLSLYVLALGLGPVLGGPLSESAGRQAVHIVAVVFGGLFALGAGFTETFAGLCILRFLSGFFYGPVLAVGSGVLNETYLPVERGLPSTIFILSPFLGPGLG